MKRTPHVRDAIYDLAKEIFLRIAREIEEDVNDDSQASLHATLREIEREWRDFQATGKAAEGTEVPPEDTPTRMAAALATLSADQRDVLFLHLGRGMPCAEIARQTGTPRLTVLTDLVRAYSRLRLVLGDQDLEGVYRH